MSNAEESGGKCHQSSRASDGFLVDADSMFQRLFERSADAILLFEPETGVFLDCNPAAVEMIRARSKEALLRAAPADLAPPFQADGKPSSERSLEVTAMVRQHGSYRFEWLARRFDGTEVPLEIIATALPVNGQVLHVVVPRDISERKRAEAEIQTLNQTLEQRVAEATNELRASEAQFRTLVENAPEAIVVVDGMTSRFQTVNENAVRLFGRSREELLRLTPADISPPFQPDGRPSDEAAREKICAALKDENPIFEWQHRHPNGKLISTEVRLLRLPGDGCCLVRASILDNTERRRREQLQQATYQISEAAHDVQDLPSLYERIHGIVGALMTAKNFYIALYDEADDGTGLINFPYFVDEVEAAPKSFPIGRGLTSYVLRTGKPLLVGPAMNARKRVVDNCVTFEGFPEISYLESGAPAAIWLGVPLSVRGRNFGIIAVQNYHDGQAYGEEEKQLLMFVAGQIAVAIERKRADQALRESEEKFRALFEASSQGVILHDEERYLEANPATLRILGFNSIEELLGKHPRDTSPPFQPGGERSDVLSEKYISQCMREGSARFDWVARNPKGQEIPVEVILTRIQMGGRQIIQAVINDITERKRAEGEMWRALEREKELSHLKSDFVSVVSHEFRTPLGIIHSSAEILGDYLDQLDPAERKEHLQSITKNARRMAELMEGVLVLGRLDAGK
ncbi:MAG TPA: PAS domain S-box protein, partial [Verrucomicrobiae bacterium]|nr:PAS domain S-box protein [Verrucomicrobiae bacterium]